MGESARRSWDIQGLGFGLSFAFLGILFAVGRGDGSVRPVHVVGVVVLAAGIALWIGALQRAWSGHRDDHEDTIIDLS